MDHPYVSSQDVPMHEFYKVNIIPQDKPLSKMTEIEWEDYQSRDMDRDLHERMLEIARGYVDPRDGKASPLRPFIEGSEVVVDRLCPPDEFPGNATEWVELCTACYVLTYMNEV